MAAAVTPFRLAVPDAELADLRERLVRTRWPEPETVDDWSQGAPLRHVQELCAYWATDYDWRPTEARLNSMPQFRPEIDGLGIHFLQVRSRHPDALPIVLTHGWPGSVIEFLDTIDRLVDPPDPADAVHVVCPSLPGYGFSDRPAGPGWTVQRIAAAWTELMARLGYRRYGAAGSDWGTTISTWIAGETTDVVSVPVGCSVFPRENPRPSRRWAQRRFPDIRWWSEPERGGHFAALEQPDLFADELRGFFRQVRRRGMEAEVRGGVG